MSLRKQGFTSGATRQSYITIGNGIVPCSVLANMTVGFLNILEKTVWSILNCLKRWEMLANSEVIYVGQSVRTKTKNCLATLDWSAMPLLMFYLLGLLRTRKKEHLADSMKQSVCWALLFVGNSTWQEETQSKEVTGFQTPALLSSTGIICLCSNQPTWQFTVIFYLLPTCAKSFSEASLPWETVISSQAFTLVSLFRTITC